MSSYTDKKLTAEEQKRSPFYKQIIGFKKQFIWIGFLPLISFSLGFRSVQSDDSQAINDGVTFQCQPEQLNQIEMELDSYFKSIGIKSEWYSFQRSQDFLNFNLTTKKQDYDTVTLKDRKEYEIENELVDMPTPKGGTKKVSTVSKKEIALALMYAKWKKNDI
jgi:hypothetical protein